jgi:hypothetical protein
MTLNTTGINGLGKLALWTNNEVGGILFDGGMIVFFVILLVIYNKSSDNPDMESAFTLSSWGMFIASALFWVGGLVDGIIPLVFLIFSAFGTFYLYASRKS